MIYEPEYSFTERVRFAGKVVASSLLVSVAIGIGILLGMGIGKPATVAQSKPVTPPSATIQLSAEEEGMVLATRKAGYWCKIVNGKIVEIADNTAAEEE